MDCRLGNPNINLECWSQSNRTTIPCTNSYKGTYRRSSLSTFSLPPTVFIAALKMNSKPLIINRFILRVTKYHNNKKARHQRIRFDFDGTRIIALIEHKEKIKVRKTSTQLLARCRRRFIKQPTADSIYPIVIRRLRSNTRTTCWLQPSFMASSANGLH